MQKTLSLLALVFALPAQALPITVDGNLSDWGIDQTTWLPADSNIHRTIEDQTGNANAFLNPGWGGQAYDAEAMYATISGQYLYVALATGHSPLTLHKPGSNSYGAGDFAIDFGQDGSYELGINVMHKLPSGQDFGVAGGVYANPVWALGLFQENDPNYPLPNAKHPTYLTGGTQIGLAQLAFTTVGESGWGAYTNDNHYFYELALDLALLEQAGWDGAAFNVHWTMN